LPPRLAPAHVVILPVFRGDDTKAKVMEYIDALAKELRAQRYEGLPVEVEVDARDIRGGDKQWEWVKKGAPLRLEIGPRDVDGNVVMVARRDRGTKDKASMSRADFVGQVVSILDEMQKGMFDRALAYRNENTRPIDARADFDAFFTPKSKNEDKPEIHGGFALSHWCGDGACETAIKDALKVTIRCIPQAGYDGAPWASKVMEKGSCVVCGKESPQRVAFAKSY
jgi:prolyl-tRNA synthetase